MADLHAALSRYFAAYARHFLAGVRPLCEFKAETKGHFVNLVVQAPDGAQHVRVRGGAYLSLAGSYWGASRAPEQRALLPILIPSLTARPLGGANTWNNYDAFTGDPDVLSGLSDVATCFLDSDRSEAISIWRRVLEVDEDWSGEIEADVRGVDSRVRTQVAACARSIVPLQSKESYTPSGVAKTVASGAQSDDPHERLAVAVALSEATGFLSYNNHLSFLRVVEPAITSLVSAQDGAAQEVALGLAQQLGIKLLLRAAYPEAKRMLDLVVPRHIGVPETLRARWECRLYLNDHAAEEDWTAAGRLDEPSDPSHLGHCVFWQGDVTDRRAVALSRIAKGLVLRAEGGDPCEDRKVPKKAKPSVEEQERLLARAGELTDVALGEASRRATKDVSRARATEPQTKRGFQADEYAARGSLREAKGDVAGALEDFESARRLRVAAGLPWQSDHFGADVRRLKRQIKGNNSLPPCFDLDWFVAESRTPAERKKALKAWGGQAWRTFPKTPKSALGTPFAYALLDKLVRNSAEIWKAASKAQRGALGDRVAFADRARPLLDEWADRPDASALESALEDAPLVAFGLLATSRSSRKAPTSATQPFYAWLSKLANARAIDEKTVLSGLPGAAWKRLRVQFESNVGSLDVERDLFDAARTAGLDGDALGTLLRAYRALWRNDWSSRGRPRSDWMKLGEPLAQLNAAKVAPVVITWTRTQQRRASDGWHGQRLAAKWLWPLYYAWAPNTADFLEEVKSGDLDNGKRLSKSQRATRADCMAWFDEAVTTATKSDTTKALAKGGPAKTRRKKANSPRGRTTAKKTKASTSKTRRSRKA